MRCDGCGTDRNVDKRHKDTGMRLESASTEPYFAYCLSCYQRHPLIGWKYRPFVVDDDHE